MADTPRTEQNKAIIRRLYEDYLNTGQLDALNEIIDSGYVGVSEQRGPAGLVATIGGLRQAFPDIQWTIQALIAEGDLVVIRWTWQGTHMHPFQGFPASRQRVDDSGITIYQFKDGKIVKAWLEANRLGFLQQIGVISKDLISVPQSPK